MQSRTREHEALANLANLKKYFFFISIFSMNFNEFRVVLGSSKCLFDDDALRSVDVSSDKSLMVRQGLRKLPGGLETARGCRKLRRPGSLRSQNAIPIGG